MHARLLAANTRTLAALLVAMIPLLIVTPAPMSAAAAVAGIVLFGAIQRVAHRFRRPEVWVLVGLLGGVAAIVGALAAYGAARSPAMALIAWPVAGLTGRYNNRVVAFALLWAIGWAELAIIAPDPSVLLDAPVDVLMLPVALVAIVTTSSVLRDLDLASRGAAIHDPLTGLLNRQALKVRVQELEHQPPVPVGLVVLDLDRFKGINDTFGHAVGDDVLREVAERMRSALGAHDHAYRIGGEEFAVLLPARDGGEAVAVAERLRGAIAGQPIAGLAVKASCGVAAGEPFAWTDVYTRADGALYAAKRAGRDRVVLAGDDAPPVAAAA